MSWSDSFVTFIPDHNAVATERVYLGNDPEVFIHFCHKVSMEKYEIDILIED